MDNLSNTHCDVCLRKGLQVKVRTICKECREFLCQECSDTHLLHKLSMNHRLIDLDPPGDETSSAIVNLSCDFLEKMTLSDSTVIYRAQVAMEDCPRSKEHEERTNNGEEKSSRKEDFTYLKATKSREFSIKKRLDDKEKVFVKCVLLLANKVVIVDYSNKNLKLFDRSGNFLTSTVLKERHTEGITLVDKDRFATCGFDKIVFLWKLRGDTIVSEDLAYDVDYKANGIHYNGTYYCVLHQVDKTVTILDSQGRRVRNIARREAFGKVIWFGYDIHMDSDTHNIHIPCSPSSTGVLCMSVEGETLWFTPLFDAELWGITEIHDTLCIADCEAWCLHMISKTGEYKEKLLEKDVQGKPWFICYDGHNNELYVNFSHNGKELLVVYSLQ